jgi:pyrroloquinoline quinone (PQQ) biosynthesis protein C
VVYAMIAKERAPNVSSFALRENLWEIRCDDPVSYVETPDGLFEVDTDLAVFFQRVRSHCTRYSTMDSISSRSGVPAKDVESVLASIGGIGLIIDGNAQLNRTRFEVVKRAVDMWASELQRDFIANCLLEDGCDRRLLEGWLLETYHYVKDFPEAIAEAASQATSSELRYVLMRYADQERGHESFVLDCLTRIGFGCDEVRESRPLLSTQLVAHKMRDLFRVDPSAALLMAAMVEARDFEPSNANELREEIELHHGLPANALQPYFDHQRIDFQLRHHALLEDHSGLLNLHDDTLLDAMIDGLHDVKHAFDLQGIEICSYYRPDRGNYVPRQPMSFAAL